MRNALLLIALGFGVSLAQAQAPVEPGDAPEASKTDADAAAGTTTPERLVERHCIRNTGTRMKARDKHGCIANAPGRSYNRDDIERTGETDVASALRRLDPSISRGN